MLTNKRQLLGLGLGLGAGLIASNAFAQGVAAEAPRGRKAIPHRKATTTVLFKAPKDKFINGVATSPQGLWIIEQKETGGANSTYHYKDGRPLEPASDLRETAWLMDDKGGVKKTVITEGRNTSGFAVGNNSLWVGCNSAGHNGVVQTSMDSKTVSHRQVPFGPPEDGGGIHGLDWHDGKLWIAALRLRAAVRIDPVTWNTELMLPFPTGFDRFHGCAYDASNDTMLVITGNNSTSYATGTPGIARLDAKTGNLVEVIDFAPNTCDPHGLTFHQGKLISCDAGLHPGWPLWDSPYAGAIFQINIA
ncbi:MAG TPA: hypothetical protein VNW15_14490 [Rhizomicrobium sp.]|jgi:hypothetical protein|nr:hypothetical protein [Rhizomicrobium sp.]